jgi:hypothetical protein
MGNTAITSSASLRVLLLAGAGIVAGCHASEPRSPEVGLTSAVHPPKSPELGRGEPRPATELLYRLYVGQTIPAVCAGPYPYFEFNVAQADGQPTLQTLVNCMKEGPLRDRSIVLIGRTDPRGASDYNTRLGLKRAESVKRYLVTSGISSDRIRVLSAGESASSPAASDWPLDRRVDVTVDE